VGQNPLRYKPAVKFPPVIGTVVTHLPSQDGYHRERLEIIKTCLNSMRGNAGRYLPILVWDNGSCTALLDWLTTEYLPDWLVISQNVGKNSARTSILRMFPFETVVCMSDDDIYYYPDWLNPQIDLLETFPDVGAVTGYPVRSSFNWGNKSTLAWAEAHAKVSYGRFIPDEWEADFCRSVGRSLSKHGEVVGNTQDAIIDYRGYRAYATSHHCQFIAQAGRLEGILDWNGVSVGDETNFDMTIDELGYLRLATLDRLTRHMGNHLDERLKQDIEVMYG
jgi:glycosyltransferase involved in cell wall biosynthesis